MKFKYLIVAVLFLTSSFIKPSLAETNDQNAVLPQFSAISTAVAITVSQQLIKARILGFYKYQMFFGGTLFCPIGNDIPIGAYNTFLILAGLSIMACPILPDNTDIGLGDLNGDGLIDIISVANGPNSIWLNNGSNGFTNSGQSLGNSNSTSVVVMDLDNDGDLDVLVGNYNQPKTIYLNDGAGFLTKTNIGKYFNETGNTPDDDPTTDFVLISENEVIQTKYAEPDLRWIRSPGTDQFVSEALEAGNTNTTGSCIHEEKNGDKYVVITKWNQTDSIFYIAESPTPIFQKLDSGSTKTNSQGCQFGDVNDDGLIDILIANYGEGNTIHTNNGDESFTKTTMASAHNTTVLFPFDLDDDGQLDLLEAKDDSDPSVAPLHYWINESITTPQARVRWVNQLDGTQGLELDLNCGSSKDSPTDIFLVAQRIDDNLFFTYSPIAGDFVSADVITPALPSTSCFTLNNYDLVTPTDVLTGNITGGPQEYRFYFGVDLNANSELDMDALYYDSIIVTLP